jgi:hypothetical protein
MRMPTNVDRLARAILIAGVSAAGLGSGAACVSPDTFLRTDDGGAGTGGNMGVDSGGAPGVGGMAVVSPMGGRSGGAGQTGGLGGAAGGSLGGRPGLGGATGQGGAGGGVAANLSDDFESTTPITDRWIAPQSGDVDSATGIACGDWAVIPEGTTTNHIYAQRSTTCTTSNPTWAAGGRTAWTDMRLQARVQFTTGSTSSSIITLGVRYKDPKDQYVLQYTMDGKIKVRARTMSSTTDLTTVPAANVKVPAVIGQWVTLGLSVSGSTVNVYVGTDRTAPPVLTATSTTAGLDMGGVAIGVSNGTAAFDDILVTPP